MSPLPSLIPHLPENSEDKEMGVGQASGTKPYSAFEALGMVLVFKLNKAADGKVERFVKL